MLYLKKIIIIHKKFQFLYVLLIQLLNKNQHLIFHLKIHNPQVFLYPFILLKIFTKEIASLFNPNFSGIEIGPSIN